jgi:FADH2 O2-dependent halogenase
MTSAFDLAVVGSGFGGSLTAMIARRLALSVLMLERGSHPRFAIGESSSPLANLLLEQLARRYELPRLLPLTEYGKWQRTYPEIGCGLKRGFSFYAHSAGRPFAAREDRSNELLVAASPCDEVADTHWLRADFDHFLVREAQSIGVEYLDHVALHEVRWAPGGEAELSGEREGHSFSSRARFVVDATGPRGFLARALRLPERPFETLPCTQALFTHFTGVHHWAALHSPVAPPYPPDAAALHHVFDGGWVWVLRFDSGITSAGVAATDDLAHELRLSEGAPAWARLLARFPSIGEQFTQAEPVRPFVYTSRLPYRCVPWSGPGWMLLPSAGAFVDPLFSTGIPLTLLGIERFGQALECAWGTGAFDARAADGAALSAREVEAAARLVGASYAGFREFPLFAALSMFYFAAASHTELARRLGRDGTQPTMNRRNEAIGVPRLFLRVDHPSFGPAFQRLADQLLAAPDRGRCSLPDAGTFAAAVRAATEPLNVAGLCDSAKRNWYPIDLRDLVTSAEKLGMSPTAMERWIEAAGWNTFAGSASLPAR